MHLLSEDHLRQDGGSAVGVFDGHAAAALLPAAEDAERLALEAGARVMRLDSPDHAGGQLLRRKAVEQQADVDDVVHVPPHVDVRRADRVGIDQLVLRQIVVKARGRFVDGRARPEREIRRETGLLKAQNFPLRPEDAHCVRPRATVFSPCVSR